jgi:transcriptional regulator NrdR family protein
MQSVQTYSIAPVIQWIAQTFLQLVLLSIILKGQNISSDKQEQIIDRINENTAKTEAAAERIEHIVELIERDTQKELKDIEKSSVSF